MNEKKIPGKGKEFFKKLKEYFFPRSKHEIISKSRELNNAEELMNSGKYDEVLLILNNLEEESLSASDQLTLHILKSSLLNKMANYEESIKIGEQAYQESQRLRDNLYSIDALVNIAFATMWLGNLEKTLDLIGKCEDLIKPFRKKKSIEIDLRLASIDFIKSGVCYFQGNSAQGLEYAKHSLEIREKFGKKHEIVESLFLIGAHYAWLKIDTDQALIYAQRCQTLAEEINAQQIISFNLMNLGIIYFLKGDYEQSQIYNKQALLMFEKFDNKQLIVPILVNISNNYFYLGDLDQAFKYLERSSKVAKEIENLFFLCGIICNKIELFVLKGDLEQAQRYLEQLEELNEQSDNKLIKQKYLFSKAVVLKASSRIHNRAKAEELLKQIIHSEMLASDVYISALLNLCELLLDELRITNSIEVLNEINTFITQLLDITRESNSYWVLAETYTLQAKLALLTLDLKGARRLLTQAQQIAEKQGMHRLAMKISIEHDNLLKELSKWENLKEQEITLSERMEMAQIDDQMKSLLWDRDLSSLENSDEDPVLILILAEGGVTMFSHIFSKDWSHEDDLVGGFLSALNSFSGELFSEGLDRAKFGRHTVLMKSFETFSICYLFKGVSYLAQKRINSFIEQIQNSDEIKETFNSFYRTHQTIELKENPPLKFLLTDIFIHKNL